MSRTIIFLLTSILSVSIGLCQTENQQSVYRPPVYELDWALPSVHPDRIMLNFGADPTSTASVTWRTNTSIKTAYAQIAKATSAPKFWRKATQLSASTEQLDGRSVKDAGIIANYHSVTFNNLEPNSLYAYRVGDGAHWSEWIQFKTASKDPDKFSFIYLGDAQNYIFELWSRMIRLAYKKAPDASFIVHAGDLVSEAHSEVQWEEWFKAGDFIHATIPSFPTPGNHEYEPLYEGQDDSLEQLSIQWRPQFTLPENGPQGVNDLKETTYFMDFQGVRMISLNSNEHHKAQTEWLEAVLSNNPCTWTIVTYHHPLFSASEGRSNKAWRSVIKPVLDSFKVDLVLQGHDHTYTRGHSLYASKSLDIRNKSHEVGTVYTVSVSGGKMYRLEKDGWNQWDAQKDRVAENTQLMQIIEVEKDTLRYKSYTATEELYDAFIIIKKLNGPNQLVNLQNQLIDELNHSNTISYYDTLPAEMEDMILTKYQGFTIDKVSIRPHDNGGIYYDVDLENKATQSEIALKIDENGVIFEEETDD